MSQLHATSPVPATEIQDEENTDEQSLIEADDLIEEVSIDGMCGVY
ncbi:mycofactocin precursor MftA [Streptomyces geranii]|nr:mycofactocin precursor MftA [Streptomyces geranii]